MARGLSLLVGFAALPGLFAPAALAKTAGAPPPPCTGRYLVSAPLGAGTTGTAVEVSAQSATIPGVCTGVAPKLLKANKKGVTKVRAEWPFSACRGFEGKKVVLSGKIVEQCSKLVGKLKGKKVKRKVQGARSRCGDGIVDGPGNEACEPPAAGTCDPSCNLLPGELPQALGITRYTVSVPNDGEMLTGPIVVTLYTASGSVLGTITTDYINGVLRSDFASPQGEQAFMSLHVQILPQSPPLFGRLVFGVGDQTVQIDLSGQESLAPGWLANATLTTSGEQIEPPGLGVIVPGDRAPAAILAPYVDGQLVVDAEGLQHWFQQNGLEDLGMHSFAISALFAVMFDPNLLETIASRFGETASAQSTAPHPEIHKNPLICEGPLALGAAACAPCGEAIASAFFTAGMTAVLAVPACGVCKVALGLTFVQWLNCKRSEYFRTTPRDCSSFPCNPANGEVPGVDERTEHDCWCTCNDDRCDTACALFAQTLSPTFPNGTARPALAVAPGDCVNNDCVCVFDPDAYCKSTFPNYCGGASRTGERKFEYVCPRASCGDGVWTQTCAPHPELNEQCDASAGATTNHGSCAANEGCGTNCQCIPCTCGPGTATPTCPIGDTGGYCGQADCQCHTGCITAADCPAGRACVQNVCVGEGSIRFTLSWDADTDFDLHVLTPNGNEIYYGNRSADNGTLDVDACVSSCERGVENVYFTNPPPGQYQYWVVNYNGKNATRANFRVVGGQGVVLGLEGEFIPAIPGAQSTQFSVNQ